MTPAFGLLSVKLRLVVPFKSTLPAPKTAVMPGGKIPTTVRLAFEVLPVPPLSELTVTLLFLTPAVRPVTLTLKLQEAPPARLASANWTNELPAVAVIVPPPQDPISPLGVATISPTGRLSTKPTVDKAAVAFGLLSVKLRLVVLFNGTLAAPKTLVMLGGAVPRTVKVALAAFPGGLCKVVTGSVVFV